MTRHNPRCVCGTCITYRLRVEGATLTLNGEGEIKAVWGGVPNELREIAKRHKAAIIDQLDREARLAKMSGDPKLGQILAICEHSRRPEAARLADLILNGADKATLLEAGLTLAELIRYGDDPNPGQELHGAALMSVLKDAFPTAVEPNPFELQYGKSPLERAYRERSITEKPEAQRACARGAAR